MYIISPGAREEVQVTELKAGVSDDVAVPRFIPDYFQSTRFDVLVHLLALRQISGSSSVGDDLFAMAHKVDWHEHSKAFTDIDGELPLADRARSFETGSDELRVRFAAGGLFLGGAVDAALALHFDRPVVRELGTARPVDRSIGGLRQAGWSHGNLRALLYQWAIIDPFSAVVLLDITHDDFAAAHHELTCRYETMHTEYDYVSSKDQTEIDADRVGSVQTLLLRALPKLFPTVIERHRDVIVSSRTGDSSRVSISGLWSPTRATGTSASHEQRMRQVRRKELASNLVEIARGRS